MALTSSVISKRLAPAKSRKHLEVLLDKHLSQNEQTSEIKIKLNCVIGILANYPAGIYLLKVNNRNTRARCEICSKLTVKTPE